MSQTIIDIYTTTEAFESILEEAKDNARTEFEEEFVESLEEKYQQYAAGMFLSDKQQEILERIANQTGD